MTAPIRHHCWNHASREAVCRCPGCARSFCRECVTEHDARLLCASCLRKALAPAGTERRARRVPGAVLLAAGVAISWSVYLALAGTISEILARMEQAAWHR